MEIKYNTMLYRRSGASGLVLPAISLGLWHNFGDVDHYDTYRETIFTALENGVIHFDLANNYGPPPGSAESNFGKILKNDLQASRDELIISTKAGYTMWDGPYGDWGSKKYLVASLDQSLKRMGLDYVDIFYHHRPDPETPLEETMTALDLIVRQGKALYVGISNYPPDTTKQAAEILRKLGTPCVIHQPKYSMLHRVPEEGLLDVLEQEKIGCIAFSPLAQGLLTNKYLKGVPTDSRAAKNHFLTEEMITPSLLKQLESLNSIAIERGQSLAQLAISWLLRDNKVTSVLVGARNSNQLLDSLKSLNNVTFNQQEREKIDSILQG